MRIKKSILRLLCARAGNCNGLNFIDDCLSLPGIGSGTDLQTDTGFPTVNHGPGLDAPFSADGRFKRGVFFGGDRSLVVKMCAV